MGGSASTEPTLLEICVALAQGRCDDAVFSGEGGVQLPPLTFPSSLSCHGPLSSLTNGSCAFLFSSSSNGGAVARGGKCLAFSIHGWGVFFQPAKQLGPHQKSIDSDMLHHLNIPKKICFISTNFSFRLNSLQCKNLSRVLSESHFMSTYPTAVL